MKNKGGKKAHLEIWMQQTSDSFQISNNDRKKNPEFKCLCVLKGKLN